jgi:hypothetical protein
MVAVDRCWRLVKMEAMGKDHHSLNQGATNRIDPPRNHSNASHKHSTLPDRKHGKGV